MLLLPKENENVKARKIPEKDELNTNINLALKINAAKLAHNSNNTSPKHRGEKNKKKKKKIKEKKRPDITGRRT